MAEEKINDLQASLYEINKASMAQINPLDPIWFNKQCERAAKEIIENKSQYWMLLCRERYDITIFNLLSPTTNFQKLANEIKITLNNRGYILDFTKREDNNYEIWIRDKVTEENFVYYLFNYANGVIEI